MFRSPPIRWLRSSLAETDASGRVSGFNRSSEYYSCRLQRSELSLLNASAFVDVFWQVSSSALADRPAPHRRWRPTLLVAWGHSLGEPLIGQPLAGRPVNETIKPRQSM